MGAEEAEEGLERAHVAAADTEVETVAGHRLIAAGVSLSVALRDWIGVPSTGFERPRASYLLPHALDWAVAAAVAAAVGLTGSVVDAAVVAESIDSMADADVVVADEVFREVLLVCEIASKVDSAVDGAVSHLLATEAAEWVHQRENRCPSYVAEGRQALRLVLP